MLYESRVGSRGQYSTRQSRASRPCKAQNHAAAVLYDSYSTVSSFDPHMQSTIISNYYISVIDKNVSCCHGFFTLVIS